MQTVEEALAELEAVPTDGDLVVELTEESGATDLAAPDEIIPSTEACLESEAAVSYTHLDVYKRQQMILTRQYHFLKNILITPYAWITKRILP